VRWTSAFLWGSICGAELLLGACHRSPPKTPPASAALPPGYGPIVDSLLPAGDVGASIRRGLALMTATRDSLPDYVGNKLRCVSCHPDGGRRLGGMPWVGVYARFPQYRSRDGRVILLADRINSCFRRSLNGKPLPADGDDMRDIIAYLAYLSRGVAVGDTVPGQGLKLLSVTSGDSAAGQRVFVENCVRCHGDNGQGTVAAPPLWGDESFNIGAGMARVRTAAAFIHGNMPFDRPGTLTEQQAFDVAVYVNSHSRPDLPGKELDWPRGNPPPDAPYHTIAAGQRSPNTARQ
jgi:thiosulfate dehydrogenase